MTDNLTERRGQLTHRDRELTLVGEPLSVGDVAPDVALRAADQSEVALSSFDGKVRLISVVPSLDTRVCDMQTRRFNAEAADLGDDVVILTVSAEHPYNQKRWCASEGIDQVVVLSDHMDMAFGRAYGTYIKEYRLEQRSIFVINREGIITYLQYVPEISEHPDYEAALAAVREILA